jgi:hypothetical protein
MPAPNERFFDIYSPRSEYLYILEKLFCRKITELLFSCQGAIKSETPKIVSRKQMIVKTALRVRKRNHVATFGRVSATPNLVALAKRASLLVE